jgi:hypothetical protein
MKGLHIRLHVISSIIVVVVVVVPVLTHFTTITLHYITLHYIIIVGDVLIVRFTHYAFWTVPIQNKLLEL